MSTETSTGNQSTVTTEQDSFSQTLESYTSLVNSLLAESDVTDDEDMATVRRVSSQLVDDAKEIEGQVEANEESVKANEEAVSETQEAVATTRKEQAQIRSRVTDVEDDVETDETGEKTDSNGSNPGPQAGSPPTQEAVTPLERVTRMDEPTAGSSLSRNQDRARSVFRDVLEYTQSVPKGRAISTPDLKRVLTAFRGGGTACYKTVGRVVDFLTEMGKDDVWTKERMNGDTVVVFSEEICKRRAAYQNQASAGDSVVSGERVAD
jgi:hypothetical protein